MKIGPGECTACVPWFGESRDGFAREAEIQELEVAFRVKGSKDHFGVIHVLPAIGYAVSEKNDAARAG